VRAQNGKDVGGIKQVVGSEIESKYCEIKK